MKKVLLFISFLLAAFIGFSQNIKVAGYDTVTSRPGYKYTLKPQYATSPLIATSDSSIGMDTGRYYISSFTRNVGRDSVKMNFANGSYLAFKDSTGGGGTVPGGADTYVQWDSLGFFMGNSGLTYNRTSQSLSIGGTAIVDTIVGSGVSGGNLQLITTNHATKGKLFFGGSSAYDEANVRLGIGTASPSFLIQALKVTDGTERFDIRNTSSGTSAQTLIEAHNGTAAFQGGVTGTGWGTVGLLTAGTAYFQNNGGNKLLIRSLNTGGNAPIIFSMTDATTEREVWRMDWATGNFSNTGAAGTAYIHLKAGTATAGTAPLAFTAGVLNTVPVAQRVETDTAFAYLSMGTNGNLNRKKFDTYAPLASSAAGTLTLTFSTDYIFTGSTTTWTLPALSAVYSGRGSMITIKNAGSGNITLNSAAGGNDIYNTSAVNTLTIAAGTAVVLMPNGTAFYVE